MSKGTQTAGKFSVPPYNRILCMPFYPPFLVCPSFCFIFYFTSCLFLEPLTLIFCLFAIVVVVVVVVLVVVGVVVVVFLNK